MRGRSVATSLVLVGGLAMPARGGAAEGDASLQETEPRPSAAELDIDEYRRTMRRGRRGLGLTITGTGLGLVAAVLLPLSHGHDCYGYVDPYSASPLGAECREGNVMAFSVPGAILGAGAAPLVAVGAHDLTFALWRYRLPQVRDRSAEGELRARHVAVGLWATAGTLLASGATLVFAGALGFAQSDPRHRYACAGPAMLCAEHLAAAADANLPRTRAPLALVVPGTLLVSAGLGVLVAVVRLRREGVLPRIGGRR